MPEELAVEVEADSGHVTGLFGAEKGTCTADFEVAHGDAEAAAEGSVLADGVEPFAGVAARDGITREEKEGVGLAVGATNAAAKLVEVGESKAVGAIDENGIGIGDVDTTLDDGGGEEDIGFAFHELVHYDFEFVFFHLAMADDDFGLGDQFLDAVAQDLDGADAVVEKEDLAAAGEFVLDGLFDEAFVVLMDFGFDGIAVGGRGVDGGHVAHAHEGKVEGAGDGGGGEGEDVDLAEAFLEGLLVFDSEALFFVDDDEAEVLVGEVGREEAVGADDDIDGAVGEAFEGFADFGSAAEAVEEVDGDGELRHPGAEVAMVLFGEDGGGAEHGHLAAAGDGLERRREWRPRFFQSQHRRR